MAAPQPRLRQPLSAPELLQTIRQRFAAIPDYRTERSEISLTDALMSGLTGVWLEVSVVAEV